jgi:hypothetical protein
VPYPRCASPATLTLITQQDCPQEEHVITPEDMKSWYAELTPLFVLKKFKPAMVFNWDEAFLHVDDESIAQVCCRHDKNRQ